MQFTLSRDPLPKTGQKLALYTSIQTALILKINYRTLWLLGVKLFNLSSDIELKQNTPTLLL